MIRLFLDANVIFTAAHNPGGKAALVIELSGRGHWQVVTSTLAAEEARRNLARKYPDRLAAFEQTIAQIDVLTIDPAGDCPLALPEKDQPIFTAATRSGATHLLTGDTRHFGPYMNAPDRTAGITVQPVADFLHDLTQSGRDDFRR